MSHPEILTYPGRLTIAGAPEGMDALLLAELAQGGDKRGFLHIARDDARMSRMAEALAFFAPGLEVLLLPAWDCLPYDRVSPAGPVVSQRIDTLTRLARAPRPGIGRVVVTTVSALLQKVPPREVFRDAIFEVKAGGAFSREAFGRLVARNGYRRAETVREPGEYAVRGGIVDIFPPGTAEPMRLDLFGDEVERIRGFDPLTQRTTGAAERLELKAMSEVLLDDASVQRFRMGYRELFGAVTDADPLYGAISAGRPHIGMEHWLPLFYERLESLPDYMPEAAITFDYQADEVIATRLETIAEFYEARRSLSESDPQTLYKPIPPDRFFLDRPALDGLLAGRATGYFTPFRSPEGAGGDGIRVDAGGKQGRDFADARANPDANLFDVVREHIAAEQAQGRRVVVASYSPGARDRLGVLLRERGRLQGAPVEHWAEVAAQPPDQVTLAVLGLEHGFVRDGLAVITEQDILGDRLVRPARKRSRSENFISEVSTLSPGDLVVHVEHGIGRYEGLETIEVAGAPHDCLRVRYDGGDKLFVPVENIEMLSRYGSEEAGAQLDRLGGAAWQARKARVKKRIQEIADTLIKVAAERQLRPGDVIAAHDEGSYGEFCARFPYPETEDQNTAIEETIRDLGSGRPMDRLVCGDVGFGKTEVALRAAFLAVMAGLQVAIVVPTTLLARQHFRTLKSRFAGFPVRIGQLSRLASAKEAAQVKAGLADGTVDIVVGTHTLLAKSISFKRLGLLIVDEEQHFGVKQKERLKQLKSNVHVLTLTATPIPRTLQLALSGVRDMSLIATPPIDRLAVRTFVLPYDPVIIREAILREHFRGGQSYYVCPRIEDLPKVRERLAELVPEIKIAEAHGRMGAAELEDVMSAFYDGKYDLLLSTNIVESGLDIPSVNTMIIHRADMFGLAQLYQLRGRVGRSKLRAYAYLTLPPGKALTEAATKRLNVMQTLDTLGAGFTLASHDMDIRGAGNLLGEEQSGHVREVGIELYQQMLEEAVAAAKGEAGAAGQPDWTPQINIGTPVLIPESYVADLGVRLGLYRRISTLVDQKEIDGFAAELVDRFGPLPAEVENLLKVVAIKRLCLDAGVEKVDAGPKGAVLSFRHNQFANPHGLVEFMTSQAKTISLRPDQKLVVRRPWDDANARATGLQQILRKIARIAAGAVERAA
ncbi:MAG TPA: transcription-repair coupling factor [Alphaproteobacteria bacterium]|nr:transcription-repair coupling factor [Alphaproteobacteria bacterium]